MGRAVKIDTTRWVVIVEPLDENGGEELFGPFFDRNQALDEAQRWNEQNIKGEAPVAYHAIVRPARGLDALRKYRPAQ